MPNVWMSDSFNTAEMIIIFTIYVIGNEYDVCARCGRAIVNVFLMHAANCCSKLGDLKWSIFALQKHTGRGLIIRLLDYPQHHLIKDRLMW